jgi:hypothetical protein
VRANRRDSAASHLRDSACCPSTWKDTLAMVHRGLTGRRRQALRAALLGLTLVWVGIIAVIVVTVTGLHQHPGTALPPPTPPPTHHAGSPGRTTGQGSPIATTSPTPSTTPTVASHTDTPAARGCTHNCAGRGCKRAAVIAPAFSSVQAALDASGVAPVSDIEAASFDCRGFSFNSQQLTADGFGPGDAVAVDGHVLALPRIAIGDADEITAAGQVIDLGPHGQRGSELGFLGAGEFGAKHGTVTIRYAGGSVQKSRLRLNDWYADSPLPGSELAASALWNVPPAHASKFKIAPVGVYYTQIGVNPARRIISVRLPINYDLHIFDIGVPAPARFKSISAAYDDAGVARASAAETGNFDGAGRSYDSAALFARGLRPGAAVTAQGVRFTWPASGPGNLDSVRAEGQTINVTGSGQMLGFLGAGTNGTQRGTVTIHYADGTVEQAPLSFADWGAGRPVSGGTVIATVPANRARGRTHGRVSVYSAVVPLSPGETVASITLPDNLNLHIFAIATGS